MTTTLPAPKTDAHLLSENMLLIMQMQRKGMYGLGSMRITKDVTPSDGEAWARECNPTLVSELMERRNDR